MGSAGELGIAIRRDGYARVADVLASEPVRIALDRARVPLTSAEEVLEEIVQQSASEGRPRYEFWPAIFAAGEVRWIRAIERTSRPASHPASQPTATGQPGSQEARQSSNHKSGVLRSAGACDEGGGGSVRHNGCQPWPQQVASDRAPASFGNRYEEGRCRPQPHGQQRPSGSLQEHRVPVSRALAGVLRHNAAKLGVAMTDGYARVADVLGTEPLRNALTRAGVPTSAAKAALDEVIQKSISSEGRPRYQYRPATAAAYQDQWVRAVSKS